MVRERIEKPKRVRSALSIAGLDPSGGAGITADLRGFRAAGVWGAAVCTVVTVQSTRGLVAAHALPAALVRAQAICALADLDVRAMKAGALGSEENVRAAAAIFAEHRAIPSVVDPVMAPSRASTAGARLDGSASHEALWALLQAATLVTPNADEASALLGRVVRSETEARTAAEDLVRAGARAVLVKGGHIESGARSVDWFATKRTVVAIARRRRTTPPLHGTGCTLSALIAGYLARRTSRRAVTDDELLEAVRWARPMLDRALSRPIVVGLGACVLDTRVVTRLRGEKGAT